MSNNKSALAQFASKDEIKALATRAQSTLMLPNGRQMTMGQSLALAQIALAHGLDPWNGEVWYIPSQTGGSVMVGIKGLRKAAKAEAKKDDSTFWGNHTRVDPKKYGEPETSVVYEYDLRDTASTKAWAQSITACVDAGIPYNDVKQMLGDAPRAIGVGIATPDEKSRMSIHQRARKRAEADALKQRYGVELIGAHFTEEDEIIEADFTNEEWPEIETTQVENEPEPGPKKEKKSEAQLMAELGFDN